MGHILGHMHYSALNCDAESLVEKERDFPGGLKVKVHNSQGYISLGTIKFFSR